MLGKLPPQRYYGDIQVRLADYLTAALPEPPARAVQWGAGITFGIFLNDRLPDCTCAAWAHSEQIHSTRAKRPERPTDENVMALFSRTGQEQGLSNNQGRYMLGVLRSLIRTGFAQTGDDPDGSGLEKIIGYAAVNPLDQTEVKAAAWLFGGLYVGAGLPLTARKTLSTNRWGCASMSDPAAAPGSWGGHAMWVSAVNKEGPVFVTWGRRVQATWCWWRRYVDEVYAVLSDDWARADYPSPSGFKRDQLVDALGNLNA